MEQTLIEKYHLLECIECGTCTGICPVSARAKLNVRRLMRTLSISKNLNIPQENELWSCTTCDACEINCPKKLSPVDYIIGVRNIVVERGKIPSTLRDALESIFKNGNPWGRIRSKRS
ncbi:MAG: 4Fe-4S dicluster domain-containing protein, partial [Candidatus Hodarchaeota archaeon]